MLKPLLPTPQGEERRTRRKFRPLHCVRPDTPLTAALGMLLEAGTSVMPVVDEQGVLLDMYARSDITMLAKGNGYNRCGRGGGGKWLCLLCTAVPQSLNLGGRVHWRWCCSGGCIFPPLAYPPCMPPLRHGSFLLPIMVPHPSSPSRLQWEDLTVGQALALANHSPAASQYNLDQKLPGNGNTSSTSGDPGSGDCSVFSCFLLVVHMQAQHEHCMVEPQVKDKVVRLGLCSRGEIGSLRLFVSTPCTRP